MNSSKIDSILRLNTCIPFNKDVDPGRKSKKLNEPSARFIPESRVLSKHYLEQAKYVLNFLYFRYLIRYVC